MTIELLSRSWSLFYVQMVELIHHLLQMILGRIMTVFWSLSQIQRRIVGQKILLWFKSKELVLIPKRTIQ